jgi:hypothetical protein
VERAGIEVRSVRPHEGSGLGIEDDAIEHSNVLKGTEQRAMKHRLKVDVLLGSVIEAHGELVRADHFEAGDTND